MCQAAKSVFGMGIEESKEPSLLQGGAIWQSCAWISTWKLLEAALECSLEICRQLHITAAVLRPPAAGSGCPLCFPVITIFSSGFMSPKVLWLCSVQPQRRQMGHYRHSVLSPRHS